MTVHKHIFKPLNTDVGESDDSWYEWCEFCGALRVTSTGIGSKSSITYPGTGDMVEQRKFDESRTEGETTCIF